MKKFFAFVFVLLVGALGAWFYVDIHLLKPLNYENPFVFELEKGTSAKVLAGELYQKKLTPFPLFARLALRFYGFDKKLKAGEYFMEENMSLKDILQKLTSGKVVMHQLTLPEGLTSRQMLEIIEKNEFLFGQITEPVGEGDMLPETYTFAKGETKNNIIKKAKEDLQKVLTTAWENRAQDLPLLSKEELLVLASIVEKETGLEAERGKVASVFVNRLNLDMPLQTDPTVIYALTLGKADLGRPLTKKDLSFDSPYNTYIYKGLPPTPICNPGIKAIQAVADPENTDFLYFVADGNGGHRFSKTLSEHNRNVSLWLKSK